MPSSFVDLSGVRLQLNRFGRGKPLLVLHSEEPLELDAPFVAALAKDYDVIVPSPPGFGRSERPDWVTSPDDIAYIYLELIDTLGLTEVALLGLSFGGWIAAELASKDDSVLSKMILVGPYGVKFGGPSEREIADIWVLPPDEVSRRKWFDPGKGEHDFKSMAEDVLAIVARNNESFARFCWEPYMHNPKLKHRLQRVKVPTLFLWGAEDGITSPDYGRRYAALIAGARMALIPQAGHYPHLEQPAEFLAQVRDFLR